MEKSSALEIFFEPPKTKKFAMQKLSLFDLSSKILLSKFCVNKTKRRLMPVIAV